MATFEKRGKSWRVTVRRKGEGRQSATFPTKTLAQAWADRVERAVAERRATGSSEADLKTLGELIGWYEKNAKELSQKWGRSKTADLNRLKGYAIADRVASTLKSRDYVRHIEERRKGGTGPATALNDIVWIKQVIRSARGSLGLSAPLSEIEDALHHLRQHKLVAKSKKRKRRLKPPTKGYAGEERIILDYLAERDERSSIPMADIVRFALATARRQEEICRLRRCDVDPVKGIAWLDDVKHPSQKIGNRRSFRILPEALAIIERQPKTDERVFPYNPRTVSDIFTNAMHFLGIEDLHFHDLRREATSRLFERGYSIQEVAQFTLHDSWETLKIYTELRPEDVPERHKDPKR
jgi:integrase